MKTNSIVNETQEAIRNPIVSQQDFPRKSARLKELIKQYNNYQHQPTSTAENKAVDSMSNVSVSTQLKTKKFDDLSPENQKKVVARIENIDYTVFGDIHGYGSLRESPLTQNASRIISKYSASDFGEVSDTITKLVEIIKTSNPINIASNIKPSNSGREWGIISSLRETLCLKRARKGLCKAMAEQEFILKNIQAIEVFLQKQMIDLRKDVEIYEQMERDTYVQLSEFELDQIGLQLMIEGAKRELQTIVSKDEIDMMERSYVQTLQSAIERMERRVYTVETIRIATIQSVAELALLIRGDEIIIEKIDEVENLVIPMWKWQYATVIGALKQQEGVSVQKTLRGISSKLIARNAKILHDNMIAAQEELYAVAVAVEDFVMVQDYINDMVTKVEETRKEVVSKTIESMTKMAEIERKNKNLMSQTI